MSYKDKKFIQNDGKLAHHEFFKKLNGFKCGYVDLKLLWSSSFWTFFIVYRKNGSSENKFYNLIVFSLFWETVSIANLLP